MLTGDDAVERARQHHDAGNGAMRSLQHVVVVAVDGNVGVHIAVTRMHVQRHPDATLEHATVDGRAFVQDGQESRAIEDGLQRRANLGFPAGAQRVILQLRKQRLDLVEPAAPECANLAHQLQGLRHPVFQQLGRRDLVGVVRLAKRQLPFGKKAFQLIAELELVGQAELNVDALDAVGVLGQARQRNHNVFVDFEGIGVARDGRRALAVQPEFFARIGTDGNEALAGTRIGDAHHLGSGTRHHVGVIACNIAHQHHLGKPAAL